MGGGDACVNSESLGKFWIQLTCTLLNVSVKTSSPSTLCVTLITGVTTSPPFTPSPPSLVYPAEGVVRVGGLLRMQTPSLNKSVPSYTVT